MKSFAQQPTPVPAQVELPPEFPEIPLDIVDRFGASAQDWQARLKDWYSRFGQAIQQAQDQTARQANSQVIFNVDSFLIYANGVPTPMFSLDSSGVRLGGVLTVSTPGRKIFIGAGTYANANTPFYVDTLGNFSLGDSFVWDADTDTLTITGIINATSGTIGGFEIGANYIRDVADNFGLSSSTAGAPPVVRFWAGDSFANRNSAPFRVYDNGLGVVDDMIVHRLIVNQAETIPGSTAGNVLIAGAVNANGGTLCVSLDLLTTVEASNNNDALWGSYLRPAFNKGAFTGLSAGGHYVRLNNSSGAGTIANAYGIYIDTVNIGTANWGLYVATTARNFMAGDLTVASIGSTTPGTGAFTTLSASGNTKLGSGAASNTEILMINRPSGSQTGLQLFQDGIESWTMGMAASVAALNWKYSGNQAMALSSTGLAVTGVVSTTDPAGGAGPNWKLGSAASVSPTAPNRTVRIDIAGTSYYLAAKTTND